MPIKSETAHLKCHIHDKVEDWEVDGIRERVCVNTEVIEFKGAHYCLFHLPTKDKNVGEFEKIFNARLKAVGDSFSEAEILSESEQVEIRNVFGYDFRYVWFPSKVNLSVYKFLSYVDFRFATFSASAVFDSAEFMSTAIFASTTFSDSVSFKSANFLLAANFDSATFMAPANFRSATFDGLASFNSATFAGQAHFQRTRFPKIWPTTFTHANFTNDVFFDRTRFRNKISFNSVMFGANSDVFFRGTFFNKNADFQYCTSEGYLRFSNVRQGKEAKFDFQEAAFEKANRISFHTVDLCPNWFVNVDSRKFIFTDIFWKHLDWDFRNKNINAELNSLADTGIAKQKKRIFEIAARQLAVNAEENNRYDEAAKFRYMAMETRRLEETKRFSASRFLIWLYKWTSGYGESWSWAALVLIGIWFGFGLIYWQFGEFHYESSQSFHESLVYSSLVMLLQKPEPRPASNLTFAFYILETILAPSQAALLALAIRRKFIR